MDSLPVTLIVKAPNQQIEDQTVKCELSWTINKLKQHLSEVYPSKPPSHEQKLIYSGQLLNDTVVLGDILRQYEGQDTHTVHLVCSPNSSTTQVNSSNNVPPQLRQRQSTSSGPSSSMPNITIPPNVTATSVNATPNVPHDMCAQYILMQQAYLQYMSHYMNLYASAANQNIPGTPAANITPQAQPIINQQPVNGDLANANNVVQPQQNALAAQNAAPANGEPEEERELLDVIYTVVRIILFSAILFYYSTPLRYLFVLFLVVCLYIYRMGFFRIVNVNNNNIVQGEPAVEEAPTRLMVAWTFFTTFFASLIPEIPNVV